MAHHMPGTVQWIHMRHSKSVSMRPPSTFASVNWMTPGNLNTQKEITLARDVLSNQQRHTDQSFQSANWCARRNNSLIYLYRCISIYTGEKCKWWFTCWNGFRVSLWILSVTAISPNIPFLIMVRSAPAEDMKNKGEVMQILNDKKHETNRHHIFHQYPKIK